MPPRAKRVASERHGTNRSHAQGLAAPGRRIPKLPSSSSDLGCEPALDHAATAAAAAADVSNVPPRVLPARATTAGYGPKPGLESPSSSTSTITTHDESLGETADDLGIMGSTQSHPSSSSAQRCRAASSSSANDIEAHGIENESHTDRIAPDASRVKPLQCQRVASGPRPSLAVATTILSICPLWDVLAMLIVLLRLNPVVVTVLHGIFAVLTFVSPSASFSIANLPSLQDLMAMDPAGAPSIQTVLLVDVLSMLCFVWLAIPAQNVLLELAQAVIAISLGGATASQGRTTSSLICCAVIIVFTHLTNWTSARQLGFGLLSTALSLDLPAETLISPSPSYHGRLYSSPGKIRSILGAHILAQGILKVARRYISSSKHSLDSQATLKKHDGEGVNGFVANSPRIASSSTSDVQGESSVVANGDGRPPGQPPNSTAKEKTQSTKKKSRKQANQLRVQQPLWAALATTKVSVAKEYEHTRPSLDAREASASGPSMLGNLKFIHSTDRVWIIDLGAIDVTFGLCLLRDVAKPTTEDSTQRNWHVKVNGASWHSLKARILQTVDGGDGDSDVWEAKVYGLSPLSSYHCEIMTDVDDEVIYDTNFITQSAPSTEAVVSMPTTVPVLQPSSPTATLRSSVRTIETETDKSRNALKTARKQHKAVLERLQSHIDREKTKLSSTGGTDERQRQRQKQLENSIAKAKSESQELERKLYDLGELPKSERQKYNKAKEEAKARQRHLEAKRSASDAAKRDCDKQVAAARADIEGVLHKRTRFEGSQKEHAFKLSEAVKKTEQAAQAKALRISRQMQSAADRRQLLLHWESWQAQLERAMANDLTAREAVQQESEQYQDWYQKMTSGSEAAEAFGLGLSSAFNSSATAGSSSLPGSRPHSLHISASGFSPSLAFNQQTAALKPNSVRALHGHRRRASSLEANSLSDSLPGSNNLSSTQSPFVNTSFGAPPGLRFAPTSSSALLADSEALSPSHAPSNLPAISPLANLAASNSHSPRSVQSPVGSIGVVGAAKRDIGRRKGSTESAKSPRAGAGGSGSLVNERGNSPMPGNGIIGSGLRNGMISPPSSTNWDTESSR